MDNTPYISHKKRLIMGYDSLVYACAFRSVFDNKLRIGRELIRHFGSFEKIFSIPVDDWKSFYLKNDNIIETICNPSLLETARKEVDLCIKYGISIIPITSTDYPLRFRECADASSVLFYRGNTDLNANRILGIVGTRRSSVYGNSTCQSIIEGISTLNPQPVIVSGLAYGIDECAHLSALKYGLNTIAVIPGSILSIYPAGHRYLAAQIEQSGGILTDRPPTVQDIEKGCFPRRNRIIAGISDAILLAESYKKGGGLITTSFASSYGRDIFAVPGRIGDKSFEGCNNLIQSNTAALVNGSESISKSMGWLDKIKPVENKLLFHTSDDPIKQKIIDMLYMHDSLRCDELIKGSGMDIPSITKALIEMELDGIISNVGNDIYSIIKN